MRDCGHTDSPPLTAAAGTGNRRAGPKLAGSSPERLDTLAGGGERQFSVCDGRALLMHALVPARGSICAGRARNFWVSDGRLPQITVDSLITSAGTHEMDQIGRVRAIRLCCVRAL